MNARFHILGFLIIGFVPTCSVSATTVHTAFKKVIQERYDDANISCATCHVEGESRQQRNELGKLFFERLEHKLLSRRYAEARKQGTGARRAFDRVLAEEFLWALEDLERTRASNGQTYRRRFLRGDFGGL